ncbi:restriction endonuclease subunit S [uncultured Pseudoalteromonas sp.]|uniref:restriction endonuclease subunit S n=1 Tax=uncultured Pseudoalteromonas sp. TaxID=114053 RepID=UPI0030D9B0F1|tara:strand:+ start:15498 stop:17504 length:2007 start_codon:yes stop_codon:yes gene_type:complete
MNSKQFLAEFGHIANAIGGVQRLREMIYNLAVTGNLLYPRIDEVDDASELLERITLEKNKRIRDKQFKRTPKFEKITAKPPSNIELPKHWTWTNLVSIGEISPKNEVEDNVDASFIAMSGVSQLHSGELLPEQRKWGNIKKGYTQFADGDVVIAKITPCFENGKSAVITGLSNSVGAGTTELHVIRPLPGVNPRYIYIFLRSPYFMVEGELNMTGTAGQKRLTSEYFATRPFPLPPVKEQAWIIKKVDELMDLCDKLEKQQLQKRKLQNQLRKSTMQALSSANTPIELKQHWQRLHSNFKQLFSIPEDIVELKGVILDLAANGRLLKAEQYAINRTGVDVLKEIELTRIEWAESSFDQELKEAKTMLTKIRKQNVEFPTDELPIHWQWATFLQITKAIIDCHNKTAPYIGNGIHLIRTTDIRNGKMLLGNTKKISDETYDYWSRRMPPKSGDIFFTREAPMGEAAIVPENVKVCLGQRTMLLRLNPELINNEFILYIIRSPSFQNRMVEAAIGMTVKHLRVGDVEDLFVPVPPKEEQDEIVSILDHFFGLCETYEKQLDKENKVAANLAIASIAALTGINILQEEQSLKTPITELVAPVALGSNKPNNKDAAPLATLLAKQDGNMNANDLWQRFGGEIDKFYAQLKTEIKHGWIAEPVKADMLEKDPE